MQQRFVCLAAGDELYAGEWLAGFQRSQGAWDLCVETLQRGTLPTCEKECQAQFNDSLPSLTWPHLVPLPLLLILLLPLQALLPSTHSKMHAKAMHCLI